MMQHRAGPRVTDLGTACQLSVDAASRGRRKQVSVDAASRGRRLQVSASAVVIRASFLARYDCKDW